MQGTGWLTYGPFQKIDIELQFLFKKGKLTV